jgi:hypothetical protein
MACAIALQMCRDARCQVEYKWKSNNHRCKGAYPPCPTIDGFRKDGAIFLHFTPILTEKQVKIQKNDSVNIPSCGVIINGSGKKPYNRILF